MDQNQRTVFLNDVQNWGKAVYMKQGWRIPYWEQSDWAQYAAVWALTILKKYDANGQLTPGHAFALVRTSLLRDVYDRSQSVKAIVPGETSDDDAPILLEPTVEDTSVHYCLPDPAATFVIAVLSVPLDHWEATEKAWRRSRKGPFYTSDQALGPHPQALAALLQWPVKRVEESIVQLRHHLER